MTERVRRSAHFFRELGALEDDLVKSLPGGVLLYPIGVIQEGSNRREVVCGYSVALATMAVVKAVVAPLDDCKAVAAPNQDMRALFVHNRRFHIALFFQFARLSGFLRCDTSKRQSSALIADLLGEP